MSKEKNWEKVLSETYVSENLSLSEDEAKNKLIEAQFALKQISQEKEDHTELNAAKEIVKDLNAGYSAATKHERAKVEFLLEVIEKKRMA